MSDYSTRCHETLNNAGFQPLQGWKVRKIVSVSENGKAYLLPLTPDKNSAVYQVDNVIITVGSKCDKLVVVEDKIGNGTVFVELKGKDISHAIEQLEATLVHKYFKPAQGDAGILRARIVTAGCGPSSSSTKVLDDAKIRFLKNFKCDLRVLKSKQADAAI